MPCGETNVASLLFRFRVLNAQNQNLRNDRAHGLSRPAIQPVKELETGRKIGFEYLRYLDRAIFLLIIFKNGQQCSANGQSGTIQSMD